MTAADRRQAQRNTHTHTHTRTHIASPASGNIEAQSRSLDDTRLHWFPRMSMAHLQVMRFAVQTSLFLLSSLLLLISRSQIITIIVVMISILGILFPSFPRLSPSLPLPRLSISLARQQWSVLLSQTAITGQRGFLLENFYILQMSSSHFKDTWLRMGLRSRGDTSTRSRDA